MILIKDGIERILTDEGTIKIFKEAGWEEKIIEEQPKSKKTTKKTK